MVVKDDNFSQDAIGNAPNVSLKESIEAPEQDQEKSIQAQSEKPSKAPSRAQKETPASAQDKHVLTPEQIAQEDEFMRDIPPINIGAFFLPPIWGLAHGFWISILYYPLWLFADNMFYAAYSQRSALSIIAAALVFVTLFAATIIFARLSQPFAAHRAASRGISKKDFLYRERIWAIASIVTGVIMLVAATYYNLFIRPSLGA